MATGAEVAQAVDSSEDVRLRVYAYRTDPTKPGDSKTEGEPVSIQIMNVKLTGSVAATVSLPVR